jgi:hypothetical protein
MKSKSTKSLFLIFLISIITIWAIMATINTMDNIEPLNTGNDGAAGVLKPISPPQAAYLWPILPNPSFDGIIVLNWTVGLYADSHYIYRDINPISSVTGLTPIGKTVGLTANYTDIISESGNYYYAIISSNSLDNCSSFNCQSVTVSISGEGIPSFEFLFAIICIIGIVLIGSRKDRFLKIF